MKKSWLLVIIFLATSNFINAQYKFDETIAAFIKECQTYSNDILETKDKEMLLTVFDTISTEKSFVKKMKANVEYGITVYLKEAKDEIDIKVYKQVSGKWKNVNATTSNDLAFQTLSFFTPSTTADYKIVILRKKKHTISKFNYYFLSVYASHEK